MHDAMQFHLKVPSTTPRGRRLIEERVNQAAAVIAVEPGKRNSRLKVWLHNRYTISRESIENVMQDLQSIVNQTALESGRRPNRKKPRAYINKETRHGRRSLAPVR